MKSIESVNEVDQLFCSMNELYGEQSHINNKLVFDSSKKYPGFIQIIKCELTNKIKGHICFIPFNEKGFEKMLDPNSDEDEISREDIFNDLVDETLYLFVYSICSKNSLVTKKLVQKTISECLKNENKFDKNSIIFAEIVSKRGEILAKRMGLKLHSKYNYKGELITIYSSSISNYLLLGKKIN